MVSLGQLNALKTKVENEGIKVSFFFNDFF